MMTNVQLVAALRRTMVETGSLACLGCGHEHNCSTQGCAILREAAELIERLQGQLAESQRRERAAVEDLNGLARFEKERCAYCLYDEECEPGEMLCSYKGDKAFEWRGHQEAGKGDSSCIKHRES